MTGRATHIGTESEDRPAAGPRRILIDYKGLGELGISLSKSQLQRLENAGRFPRRVRYGGGQRFGWVLLEIEGHLRRLIAERDGLDDAA